jgi:hypothetical protein
MLKIGVVRWRGKCARHPMFDPFADGLGAIKGNCERCTALLEIHNHHQHMLKLMRSFAPPLKKKSAAQQAFDDAQASLF